jgi:hypothetical protein
MLLPVMSGEGLPYNRPTSPQSSLSQPIADSLSIDGGIVRSCVTRAVVVAILYLSCRCDVRMYRSCAGVVTHCLPLRGRSAVRPVSLSQYGPCNLLPWPHLQSSCLLVACLRHVHACGHLYFGVFQSHWKGLFSVVRFHNCDLITVSLQ